MMHIVLYLGTNVKKNVPYKTQKEPPY